MLEKTLKLRIIDVKMDSSFHVTKKSGLKIFSTSCNISQYTVETYLFKVRTMCEVHSKLKIRNGADFVLVSLLLTLN